MYINNTNECEKSFISFGGYFPTVKDSSVPSVNLIFAASWLLKDYSRDARISYPSILRGDKVVPHSFRHSRVHIFNRHGSLSPS